MPDTDPPVAPAAAPPAPVAGQERLRGVRILLVDDSVILRRVLSRTLRSFGALVEEAEDGKAALGRLLPAAEREEAFELVLLDLDMPVMDGKTLLRMIRNDPLLSATPVLMHTTESGRAKVVECAGMGISGYLVKPSKTERIVEAVAKALATPLSGTAGPCARPGGRAACLAELRDRVTAAARAAIAAGESTAASPDADRVVQCVLGWIDEQLHGAALPDASDRPDASGSAPEAASEAAAEEADEGEEDVPLPDQGV
ncbi:MAG: response regulator [Planctomycetota bacterium]